MKTEPTIEESRAAIDQAQLHLLKAYLREIELLFSTLNASGKQKVIDKIELILEKPASLKNKVLFDWDKARQCRENLSMTRKELSGVINLHTQMILKYETGIRFPKKQKAEKYLQWLKTNGYPELTF